jgi:two-component system chemotaxis response regulator CheB
MTSFPNRGHIAPIPWFVAIGASGSGLQDIIALLIALSHIDAVVLTVLHRLFDHPSQLSRVLSYATDRPVIIAKDGEHFEPGSYYIGEPSAHLTVTVGGLCKLVQDPVSHFRNRTIDLLFQSVASHGGNHMIGVILSGFLDDGSRGLAAIHDAGGWTMVVTPAIPRQFEMPDNAINYDGPITYIGSPQQIADAIHGLVKSKAAD